MLKNKMIDVNYEKYIIGSNLWKQRCNVTVIEHEIYLMKNIHQLLGCNDFIH